MTKTQNPVLQPESIKDSVKAGVTSGIQIFFLVDSDFACIMTEHEYRV